MKNEELDRLFKQKSELFRAEPSPQAWQQLEAHLQHKKRGKKIWLYLSGSAAGILLLVGIWFAVEHSSIPTDSSRVGFEQKKAKEEVMDNLSKEVSQTQQNDTKVSKSEISQKEKYQKEITENEGGKTKQEKELQEVNKLKNEEVITQKTAKSPGSKSTNLPLARHQKINGMDGRSSENSFPETELPQLHQKAIASIGEPGMEELPLVAANVDQLPENIIIRYSPEDDQMQNQAATIEAPITSGPDEKELSARAVIGFLKKVKENSSESLSDIREAKNEILSFRLGRYN